jgi:hypothetical protein
MFDLDGFCTALTASRYGGFPPALVAAIRTWAANGRIADRAPLMKKPGWVFLDPTSEALLVADDDLVVRRILLAFLGLEMDHVIIDWLEKRDGMRASSGLFASLVADWEAMGMVRGELYAALGRRIGMHLLVDDSEATAIGAWLLTVPDAELDEVGISWQVVLLFAYHAPARAQPIVRKAMAGREDIWRARLMVRLLRHDAARWLPDAVALLPAMTAFLPRFLLLDALVPHRPDLHDAAEQAAVLAAGATYHDWDLDAQRQGAVSATVWILAHCGARADGLLAKAWAEIGSRDGASDVHRAEAVAAASTGTTPLPGALRVAVKGWPRTAAAAIVGLAAQGAPAADIAALVCDLERRCTEWLADEKVANALQQSSRTRGAIHFALAQAIEKAGPARTLLGADALRWMGHADSRIRRAAARLLAADPAGLPARLQPALTAKSADARLAAVECLVAAGSPECLAALGDLFDHERSDDVRDALMAALAPLWERQGRTIGPADLAAWIKRSDKSLAKPVAAWLDEQTLPPLARIAGGPDLTAHEQRWLCWRQARQSDIVLDREAKHLLKAVDHARSGAWALALATAFLASKQDAKDRWALVLACALGDDRLVPLLHRQIDTWVEKSRGKLAEYGAEALALLGSDAALQAVDAIANAYRAKNRNVGAAAAEAFAAAAARRGMTIDELGDAVVPWLGFRPGETRTVPGKKDAITITIATDGKLAFRSGTKTTAALPAGVSKETKDEVKQLAASLRETVKSQIARHGRMLVLQRRWPAAAWLALYVRHPVLKPFAVRLVWGHFADDGRLLGSFRLLEDGTATDAGDNAVKLPATGLIGMVHPLELSSEERVAWNTHFADHEVAPPVPQLERPVQRVKDGERTQRQITAVAGIALNGMTFKGRAERLGWRRGSVVDAGGISGYRKSFPASGIDVCLNVDGMYMGMGQEDSITLGAGWFVRHGTVASGSYVYDEPTSEADPRVVPFGDVPPIVFSETMADLRAIIGQGAAGGEEAEE